LGIFSKNKSDKPDDPNQLGSVSIKEISIIVAVVSITITMLAATALILIVSFNLDWTQPENQAIGLKLLDQVVTSFSAITHSSILLIGMGSGMGAITAGMLIANKINNSKASGAKTE